MYLLLSLFRDNLRLDLWHNTSVGFLSRFWRIGDQISASSISGSSCLSNNYTGKLVNHPESAYLSIHPQELSDSACIYFIYDTLATLCYTDNIFIGLERYVCLLNVGNRYHSIMHKVINDFITRQLRYI